MTMHRGLYGMVDLPPSGEGGTALARALIAGGARVLQLRMKGAEAAPMLAAAGQLRSLCSAEGVTFIVNDRLDVALICQADGVHLGQDDLPLAAARQIAPPGFLIGISTHTLEQARAAAAADYIGFGPCFPTATKLNPDPVVGLEALREVCRLPVPVVAIGGIALDAVPAVARAGATAAAVIRAVNGAAEITAAARAVQSAFAAAT